MARCPFFEVATVHCAVGTMPRPQPQLHKDSKAFLATFQLWYIRILSYWSDQKSSVQPINQFKQFSKKADNMSNELTVLIYTRCLVGSTDQACSSGFNFRIAH